jgi:hypothetical protein
MKVTLFTSNNHRHNYLINLLSNYCDELYVVQEFKTFLKSKNVSKHKKKNIIEKYFTKVLEAESQIFKKNQQTLIIKILKLFQF